MIRAFRVWAARRKLEKLLRQRRGSFQFQDYLRRRDAALRGRQAAP
jgi:hypothetical protein